MGIELAIDFASCKQWFRGHFNINWRKIMSEKVYTIEEIREMLGNILENEPVYKVILFGSYAKKEATKKSDIDLVIDTKSKLKGFALLRLICQIEEKLQKNVDGFEQYEIIENSKIDEEIKKTGVVVYEK